MKIEQGWAFECGLCKQRGELFVSKQLAAEGLVKHFDKCNAIYDGCSIETLRTEIKRLTNQVWSMEVSDSHLRESLRTAQRAREIVQAELKELKERRL